MADLGRMGSVGVTGSCVEGAASPQTRGDSTRDEIELRPRRRTNRPWAAMLAWGAALAIGVLRSDGLTRAFIAVSVLVMVALTHRYVRRAALTLRDGVLSYTGLFRRRIVARPGVSVRAVTAEVLWSQSGPAQRWLLLDAGGATALGLDLTAWKADELSALCERAGIPQQSDPTRRRPAELRRAYPGGLPWVLAHPFIGGLVLIVVATIVVVLLGGG